MKTIKNQVLAKINVQNDNNLESFENTYQITFPLQIDNFNDFNERLGDPTFNSNFVSI